MRGLSLVVLLAISALGSNDVNCTYLSDPSEFQYSKQKHWQEISDRTNRVAFAMSPDATRAATADRTPPMPRKNFIDEYIRQDGT